MPKCKNCGAEVKEGDLFCGFCGKRIETAPQAPAQPLPQPQLQQAAYAKEAMAQAQQPPAAPAAQPVMQKEVALKSPLGEVKSVSVGPCRWGYLFSIFVCLYRKDFKTFIMLFIGWNVIILFMGLILPLSYTECMLVWTMMVSMGKEFIASDPSLMSTWKLCFAVYVIAIIVFNIIFALKYNAFYIKRLLSKGWQPLGPNDAYTLRQKGIMI